MTDRALACAGRTWSGLNTAQQILLGYLLISLAGLLALWAIEGTAAVRLVDHLFTSVSAVSTTGLTTVTIASDYSFAGQVVILALIQIGGLGYMTLAAVFISRFDRRIGAGREEETENDFALPPEADVRAFAKAACIVTLCAEILGAAFLFAAFREARVEQPLWHAVFHSVSAFCTSGLSLFPDSFERFSGDAAVLLPISVLSFVGAIGFLVAWDVGRSLRRREFRLLYTNRVVLIVFVPMLLGGTILLWLTDGRLAGLGGLERWLNAFFAAMTSSTTVGFHTLATPDLSGAAFLLVAATMVVGASPSGTSGGIKTTTTAVLVATMISSLRQQDHVRLFGKRISPEKIRASTTTLVFYCVLMLVAAFVLAMIEPRVALRATFFEVISALGTIGLSFGASEAYGAPARLIVATLMIVGRVGILAFGAALFSGEGDERQVEEAERV